MSISVIIPVYNGSRTIQATLDSALKQTLPADEILVMDDGSTDDTFSLLKAYAPRVTAFHQENRGVAAARNALCAQAQGDLIAFLDADDLWHPHYLATQYRLFKSCPAAVAFFASVVTFSGYATYDFDSDPVERVPCHETLAPLTFLRRLGTVSGRFVSPSLLCVPKSVLAELGSQPFCETLSGVEDSYLLRRLVLLGDVVTSSAALVAYRVNEGTLSGNKVNACRLMVDCYKALEEHYLTAGNAPIYKAFRMSFASQVRQYAKRLMGAGKTEEARRQICSSLTITGDLLSLSKSVGFLLVTFMPEALQPIWPSPQRDWS